MMMSCLIVVELASTAIFKQVAFDVDNHAQAERLAALHAGELSNRTGEGQSRFGFRCGDGQWVALDLEFDEAFRDPKNGKAKAAKNRS